MSHDLFSFTSSSSSWISLSTADRVAPSSLLVREDTGDYRPAQANEVLQAAQCMLAAGRYAPFCVEEEVA